MSEIAELFTIFPSTIPTPAAIALALAALAAGWAWMRVNARHQLAAARRLSASTAAYYVRAESACNRVRAIEEPTQSLDLIALRAAMLTRRERLVSWAHDQVARIRDEVTYKPPQDWTDSETAAFRRIVDNETRNEPNTMDLAVPTAPQAHEPPAPPLPVVPALVIPPWSEQTPARRDPAKRLPARQRIWNASLLQLKVPPLSLPAFPEMFRMPQPRTPSQLPHSPARMAMLKPDPMRRWRRPAQVAM